MYPEVDKLIHAGRSQEALSLIDTRIHAAQPRQESAPMAAEELSWLLRRKAQCLFQQNLRAEAGAAARESLEHAEASGDTRAQAEAHNALGVILASIHDHDRALFHLEASYSLHREAHSDRLAPVLNNIGNEWSHLHQWDRALEYFRKALEEAQRNAIRHVEGISLGNVGRALSALERHEEAIRAHRRAIHLFADEGMWTQFSHALMKLGHALEQAGRLNQAERAYRHAADSMEHRGDTAWIDEIYGALGSLLVRRTKPQEGIHYLRQAISALDPSAANTNLPDFRHALSSGYEQLENLAEALEHERHAFDALQDASQKSRETGVYEAIARVEMQRVETEKELYRVRNEELEAALKEVEELRAALEDKNAELSELVVRDPLTGMYNRRFFASALKAEIQRKARYGGTLSLAMLDLDNFKEVNDTYGHRPGDQVLAGVAEVILRNTRATDIAARYGGEEFAVIMPGTDAPTAEKACEKLRSLIEGRDWGHVAPGLTLSVSVGVGRLGPQENQEEFVTRVDGLLYHAKHTGRNRVVSSG